MELIETDRVIFLLTAAIKPGSSRRRGDFMATVKVTAEKKIEMEYRFRWHTTNSKMDMDGGHDDDEKQFFVISPVDDSPEARQMLIAALRRLAVLSPGFRNSHEELGEWTPKEFMFDVMMRGPMHTQLTLEQP